MTDKVRKIRQEIERLKTKNEIDLDKEYTQENKWYKIGAYDTCFQLLNFIDSLQDEDSSDECPCCGWALDSDGCCGSCGYGRK